MARQILIVAHPGALGVELLGIRDILETANAYARGEGFPEPFEVELATHDGAPIQLWSGLELGPVQHHTNPIFIIDGDLWTSAGVTSGFDMLLALVEQDVSAEAARYVSRSLVLYLRRTGNQSQFSGPGRPSTIRLAHRGSLRDLQQHIADNPSSDLSVTALAKRVNMSPRHFTRVFQAEVGVSPHQYVERVRLQTARRLLEETDLAIEAIAVESGFGSYETIRRVFSVALDVAPKEYRRRFGCTPVPEAEAGLLHRPLYARTAAP